MARFGFIHDKLEIKILILFITRRLSAPVDLSTLASLTICDDGISYFDFAECVSDLVATEHLTERDGLYAITEKGDKNGAITESSIPYSVRIKAERAALALAEVQKRAALVRASHEPRLDGNFTVHLDLDDDVGNIMHLSLLAGSEDQALALESGFRQKAESLYSQIIDSILDS